MSDPLDRFIEAAAEALALPIEPAWTPAIRANLEVTLAAGRLVDEFPLPDAVDPAPVYRA
jgi:hypothetical protein